MVSNLARFVVIVWVFVVLILTQSYTASLTSLLTVQKLEPTYANLSHLISNTKEYVGCKDGSFVCTLLQQGFNARNIRTYKSAEECDQLLMNGSANGGIAAAIDQTPKMKLFLATYCTKYTMIGPIIKTNGFAFVRLFSSHTRTHTLSQEIFRPKLLLIYLFSMYRFFR